MIEELLLQIDALKENVLDHTVGLAEAQIRIGGIMSASPELKYHPTDINKMEREDKEFENDIELIIYGQKSVNQIPLTIDVR